MTDSVPRPEFERVVKSTDNHLEEINSNIAVISKNQNKFIIAQTKINATSEAKLEELDETNKGFKKVGYLMLVAFVGLAGIGSYNVLTTKSDHETHQPSTVKEETPKFVSIYYE